MTLAYKFLARGAVGPISGFAWPAPGAWIEITGALIPGRRGAHVCRAEQLAHWLHDELWQCEVAGEQLAALDCIVASRARLIRRVDAWTAAAATQLADACIAHAGELLSAAGARGDALRAQLADAREAITWGYPAIAAFNAAVVVAHADPHDPEGAYARERAWQGSWIASALIASDRP